MARDEVWEKIKNDRDTVYGEPMLDMFLKTTERLDRNHWEQLTPRQKSLVAADIRMSFASNKREAEMAAKEGATNFGDALISGAHNGDVELCRWGVEKGAFVGDALVVAAERGHAEICQLLVARGAHAHWLRTAIRRAKSPEVRKILVKAWREGDGKNLMLQQASNVKEAERAVKAGANRLDAKTLKRWFDESKTGLVRWWLDNQSLLDKKTAESEHPWFFTRALERAAEAGDLPMCKTIVEAGLVKYTSSALDGAAYRGHIKVCSLLLDNGDFTPYGLESPLYKAAKGGRIEVCKLLVQRGAKPSLNALGGAVESGKIEVCRWFIEDMGVRPSTALLRHISDPELKEYIEKKLQDQG